MRLYFVDKYDRYPLGPCPDDIMFGAADALCNGGRFAVPDAVRCPEAERKLHAASYRELQAWAKALGVSATGETDELTNRIVEALHD